MRKPYQKTDFNSNHIGVFNKGNKSRKIGERVQPCEFGFRLQKH